MNIKSLLNPNYIVYTRSEGFYESGLLVYAFGQYDTYGDRDSQHSPVYRIGPDRFTDFCLSFSQHLIQNPEYQVHAYELGLEPVRREVYDFLRSVKYDDTAQKYFSLPLLKITKSKEKQHDKRWIEVPTWADGSVKSALDLYWYCQSGRDTLLRHYAVFESFREVAGGSFLDQDSCETFRNDLFGDHCQAFRALKAAMESKEQRDWSVRLVESALFNSTPRQAQAQAA